MNEGRWFALCILSGALIGIAVVLVGAGAWLYSPPLFLAGLWYGREAHKEASR